MRGYLVVAYFGTVTALPSGRFRARYREADGARSSAPFTFQTKKDAGAWLAEKQTELAKLAHRPAEVIKAEAAAKLARTKLFGPYALSRIAARDLSERTAEEYGKILRRHLMPYFGDMPLVDISSPVIRAWYDGWLVNRQGQRTKALKARAAAYSFLTSVMNDAVRDEIIPTKVGNIVRGSKARRDHIPVILSPREVGELAEAMPERFQVMILLAAWCAPRYGELIALRRSDFDVDATNVSITRAGIRLLGQGVVASRTKSEAGVRDVALPGPLAMLVANHLARFTGPEPDALLFPGSSGNMLPYTTFTRHFSRARLVIGEPTLHLHDLRHVGATRAAETGATLAQLMARIGHSTAAAALIYQHASRSGDRQIADKLAELMPS